MTLLRFLLVGIANTLIGLSVIYGAMYFLRLPLVQANALGYAVGILVGFALNRAWTFRSNDRVVSSFIRYLLVLVSGYVANLVTVLIMHSRFGLNAYVAQAIGIMPYVVVGFLGSRYFVFRKIRRTVPLAGEAPYEEAPLNKIPTISRAIALSIVVPCYNEEAVLSETARRLSDLLQSLINSNKLAAGSCVYFVDDGSLDRTWELIASLAENNQLIKGIKLSRNRGHQNALVAGLFTASGEAVISVDADLQDDLSAIESMISYYASGFDIVYGVRNSRKADTFFKSLTAKAFYKFLAAMGVEIVYNHADYRLLSRRVIEALREFTEVNLFLRGIIPQLGFSHASVYYDRAERYAGESKYPLRKMLSFAWQGITSFSAFPLRLITGLGVGVSFTSLSITGWVLWVRLFTHEAVPGWASTVLPIYFLGGVQLLCLGIIGEYVAKIYAETKRRPLYIIDKTTFPYSINR